MQSKTWGTPLQINETIQVGGNTEIPAGKMAWVFNASRLQYETIWDKDWEAFMAGDVTKLKEEIEKQIPHAKVQWISFYWDKTEKSDPYYSIPDGRWKFAYHVYGFHIEAIVKNEGGASLTGFEIIGIITAIVIGIAILALFTLGAWTTIQIMNAANKLGPVATIGTGLLIVGGIGVLLFVMFGGSAEYRGKKRRVRIGKR